MNEKQPIIPIQKACVRCDSVFHTFSDRAKYCSPSCRNKTNAVNTRERRKAEIKAIREARKARKTK